MLETKKGRRMDQILATGISRGELAEVLWCTEDELRAQKECSNGLREIRAELETENAKLRWKLEVLKAYGIEIVDAVAGGYEIYSDDHKEAERLKAENEKLRRAFNETLARLSAANEVAVVNYMDEGYCEMLREMRIEVGE